MQGEQVRTGQISVQICSTASALDRRMEALADFLTNQFAGVQTSDALTIDIGFLGLSGLVPERRESWQHGVVYPIRLHFASILLGPACAVEQSGGPCPYCLEQRWLSNHGKAEEYTAYQQVQRILAGPAHQLHASALQTLWNVVSSELHAGHPQPGEHGKAWFYALSLDSLRLQRYQLIADSSCPVCAVSTSQGAGAAEEAGALQLVARPKGDPASDRLVDAVAYPLPEAGWLDSMSGVLGLTLHIGLHHTVTASAMGSYYLQGKAVSWGGNTTTLHSSQRSGMLEGLERYCGLLWPRANAPVVTDSYAHLGEQALDPRTCGLYPPETYRIYESQLAPFNPHTPLDWVQGYSFRRACPILVPTQLAYYARKTAQGERAFVFDTSNGCALGSCLEEAILHGLLELIERDAFFIHWYARLAAPRLDPWSSRNVKTLRLLDRIERLGYDIFFLDTRLDLPIPTVTAVGRRRSDELGKISVAAGASLDPEDAIRSALREVAAAIPALPETLKVQIDDIQPLLADFTRVRILEQHALLYGFPQMAHHVDALLSNPVQQTVETAYAAWDRARPRHSDLLADLRYCVERVLNLGLDVVVVDQTAAELAETGLKVVRVIVPGLVPIDFGWGRHRVYTLSRMQTVPRTAGYRETDFDLAQVNPIPHPFP